MFYVRQVLFETQALFETKSFLKKGLFEKVLFDTTICRHSGDSYIGKRN